MFKVNSLNQTCGACPAQWEGHIEDSDGSKRWMYVRYRHGYLSVRISPVDASDPMDAVVGEEILGTAYGDSMGGVMSEEELIKLTAGILDFSPVRMFSPPSPLVAPVANGRSDEQVRELLEELLEELCPKGGTPLDRGHAIVALAQLLIRHGITVQRHD